MSLSRRTWCKRLLQWAGGVPILEIWFRQELAASPQMATTLPEPSPGFARERIASAFDWDATAARRPLFNADYFMGFPSIYMERRDDWAADLEKITYYVDRVAVRGTWVNPTQEVSSWTAYPGEAILPDLMDPVAVSTWVEETRQRWTPIIAKFRQYGLVIVPITAYFNLSGGNSSPQWYRRRVPDFNELPADSRTYEHERKMTDYTCLANPQLYEVADLWWDALARVMQTPTFVGTYIENEPWVSYRMGARGLGGNPHTQKLFREFLRRYHGDVELFNRVAGTHYKSFDDVAIGDDNWLVYNYANRYRAWLPYGHYEKELTARMKKRLPKMKAFTRYMPFFNTDRMGADTSYAQEVASDFIGFTFHVMVVDIRKPGEAETDQNYRKERLGQLAVYGGLFRGAGKPLILTEPMFDRGFTFSVPRDYELLHLVYRGLFYRLGAIDLHSWSRPAKLGEKQPIYNYFYGTAFAHHPNLMAMFHRVREELDRIAPYETFGKAIPPPIAILVTRNAYYFPGRGSAYYGDFLYRLGKLMEEPEWCLAEVIEEHDYQMCARLKDCKGVILVGTGFEDETWSLLASMVKGGTKLLHLSAPASLTSRMAPRSPDSWMPVESITPPEDLTTMYREDPATWVQISTDLKADDIARGEKLSSACQCLGSHPTFRGMEQIVLFSPASVTARAGGQVVAQGPHGAALGLAKDNVVFLGGIPSKAEQQRNLYVNFAQWCGLKVPGVFLNRFERATVVQHFDARNEDYDGNFHSATWRGNVPIRDGTRSGLWEARKDFPWLAYHYEGGETIAEAVRMDALDVRVFRKEKSQEMPHFAELTEGVGISLFWYDVYHIVAELSVGESMEVRGRFVPTHWGSKPFRWFVFPKGVRRPSAEGHNPEIVFRAEAGISYTLGVAYQEGHLETCTLCNSGWYL